jgi:hypothetical protein
MTVRSATLHLENKAKSEALATACLNVAQIALINDSDFETHNKSVALEGASCNIEYIEKHTPMHGTHRIKVHASSSGATTNYLADISASTSLITRLEEVVN